MTRAREVDPLSSVVLSGLGRVHYFAGRYQQAIELFRQTLKAEPRFLGSHFALIMTRLMMGEIAEAEAQLDQLVELVPTNAVAFVLRGCAAVLAGRRADAERELATLTSRYQAGKPRPDEVAILSAWLGDSDQTLHWLKIACEDRGASLAFVEVEPGLAPLTRDPRYRELLHQYDLLNKP